MDMEKRHSSPYSRTDSPRPSTYRKRSNSFPLVDALGCSTPEAELILAEGRAAIRTRYAAAQRRGLRNRSDEMQHFRPRDHLKYLEPDFQDDYPQYSLSPAVQPVNSNHSRIPSNITDKSGSTITGFAPTIDSLASPTVAIASPLDDYSASLAKFIQTQLNSIASYQPSAISPRSCPDLTLQPRSPPLSPASFARRQSYAPRVIDIPPVRPPLQSQFSAWSSTDDEADNDNDFPGSLPSVDGSNKDFKGRHYTPSILQYYESANNASFLFSSTPLEEEHQGDHPNADGFTFPNRPTLVAHQTEPPSTQYDLDYPSSDLSSRPQLTASSAPSFTSTSTASYFDCKRPITFAPHVRDRIIAAVSPLAPQKSALQATSPFEGGALANVHDILVESQHRVLVDGFSFDLVQHMNIPEAAPRVTTPC